MITVIEDITLKKARLKNFCSFLMPGLLFLPFLFYSLLTFFYGSPFCSPICPVMFTSSSCLLISFLLGSHGDGKRWGFEYGLSHLLSKPNGSVGKESTCDEGDTGDVGSIPGSGISPGEEGNPLQYSRLEHPMDRGALWAKTQRVEKSRPRLTTKHSTLSLISNMTWDELTSLSPSFLIG